MKCTKNDKFCFLFLPVGLTQEIKAAAKFIFSRVSSVFMKISLPSVQTWFSTLKVQQNFLLSLRQFLLAGHA
jgi:hypothetical protein